MSPTSAELWFQSQICGGPACRGQRLGLFLCGEGLRSTKHFLGVQVQSLTLFCDYVAENTTPMVSLERSFL